MPPRPTRVLYVENDPTLRGILATQLNANSEIQVLAAVGNSSEALKNSSISSFDVALLDLSLGANSLNGVELGIELRRRNSNLGVVIFSQHANSDFLTNLPEQYRWGWSAIRKAATINIQYLVEVLKSTSLGLNVIDPAITQARSDSNDSPIEKLTGRQRQIISFLSQGHDATKIAETLGLAHVTIRQEISRIYQIFVPNPTPGTDLRTTAVLRYLRESRMYEQVSEKYQS